jgi:23S rRNA (adenine2503-C2)-methyltransferase
MTSTLKATNSKDLKDLDMDGLISLMEDMGEKPFRARQLYGWLFHKGAGSIIDMTDISLGLRDRLEEDGFCVAAPELVQELRSSDGSMKFVLGFKDGERAEAVIIPDVGRLTLCISTQSGCALGCGFCMTGQTSSSRTGKSAGRNLTLGELIAQVSAAERLVRKGLFEGHITITNVVLMGMGEPLLNLDNVVKFIAILTDQGGMGYAARRVTLSTAGIVPAIKELGKRAPGINLAVSLNAATDEVRDWLMPINKKYPLKQLILALREYPLKKRRRITIEYVLLRDVNDTDKDAKRLAHLLRYVECMINIIPFNPFPGTEFERPDDDVVKRFQQQLLEEGFTAYIRSSHGADIGAACGQLGSRRDEG